MRLALNLGYWGFGQDAGGLVLAEDADALGYDVVWAAEAYGSDAPTVLAWVASRTRRIDIGAAVMQIPARTPATTAMTAATLDALSGGRFRLGLGVSGPQVSEGWHGVRFAEPLSRTEEYVEIVRAALRRERLQYAGKHWTLPLPDGPGRPITLTVHPVREQIPLYLAAVGPRNLQLTGRIAQGWLAVFFSPEHAGASLDHVRAGRVAAGHAGGDELAGFDVVPTVPVAIGDDLDALAVPIRSHAALYLGGMGSQDQNFYHAPARRMGFAAEAARVQDLYLARRYDEAAAAVPRGFVDATALIGPPERIRDRLHAYAEAGVTTLAVAPFAATLQARRDVVRRMAEILEDSGLDR